jgi:septum site-determining protein MinC
MAVNREKDDIELRGEGGHLRLITPSRLKGKDIASEAKVFLEKASPILRGAGVIVDLMGSGWSRDDIIAIVDGMITPAGANVVSWSSGDPEVVSWMKKAGMSVSGSEDGTGGKPAVPPVTESLVIDESLRSGWKIDHNGDIIVLGNVNEGAEVFAGGSVFVMGRLRGLAHAGLTRPEESFIVSGQFEASQVRIGERISYMDENCPWWGRTVSMRFIGGSIVVREIVP